MKTGIIVPARLGSQRFLKNSARNWGPLVFVDCRAHSQHRSRLPLCLPWGTRIGRCPSICGLWLCLTDPNLPSGTDRIRVANQTLGFDAVINVQADEPLIQAEHINQLRNLISDENAAMAPRAKFTKSADVFDPNKVKAVRLRRLGPISPVPMPYPAIWHEAEDGFIAQNPYFWHLDYAYKADFCKNSENSNRARSNKSKNSNNSAP